MLLPKSFSWIICFGKNLFDLFESFLIFFWMKKISSNFIIRTTSKTWPARQNCRAGKTKLQSTQDKTAEHARQNCRAGKTKLQSRQDKTAEHARQNCRAGKTKLQSTQDKTAEHARQNCRARKTKLQSRQDKTAEHARQNCRARKTKLQSTQDKTAEQQTALTDCHHLVDGWRVAQTDEHP